MGKSKKCGGIREEAIMTCITVNAVDGFTLCAKFAVTCPPRPLSQGPSQNPEVHGRFATVEERLQKAFARQEQTR